MTGDLDTHIEQLDVQINAVSGKTFRLRKKPEEFEKLASQIRFYIIRALDELWIAEKIYRKEVRT